MAHNSAHYDQGQTQAGWGAMTHDSLGPEAEPSHAEPSENFGQNGSVQVENSAPHNLGVPQNEYFDANAYARQEPVPSTFNWPPGQNHGNSAMHGYPAPAGPSYTQYGEPMMAPTQPYGSHNRPPGPAQPYVQSIAPSQPTVLPHPHHSFASHAPPSHQPQPAALPQHRLVQQFPPPRGPSQGYQAPANQGYQGLASGSSAHVMPQPGVAYNGARPLPPAPGAASTDATSAPVSRAPRAKRVRCEEVEDEDVPVVRPAQHANAAGRAQIFNQDPRRQNDVTREQAVQDAIRHLAQPRAAPNTSQADRANSREQRLKETQGAGPEDGDEPGGESENDADSESEEDAEPPRRRQTHRRDRGKRRRLATPEYKNTGNRGRQEDQGDSDDDDGAPAQPSPPQPRPIPNWDQTIPCTIPAGRQSRTKPRVKLARYIRKTLLVLLGRPTRSSPLPPLPADDVRYPTLNKYSIRFDQSETSIFNQIAANVAALQIRRDYPGKLSKSLAEELPDMVTNHIRYLCRCYKSELKDDADELRTARLKRASANSRAHTLFESRLKIIDRFPNALGHHRALFVHLGIEGTSSDEEEPGPPDQPRVYLVKRRVELSSNVQKLKNLLDLVYNLYCKGRGSKGSPMHIRRPSNKVSERPFMIEGLPITCISRTWYQALSKPEREFYQFVPHNYDYSFPEELLRRPDIEMEVVESSEGGYSDDSSDDEGEEEEDEDEDEDMHGDNQHDDEDGNQNGDEDDNQHDDEDMYGDNEHGGGMRGGREHEGDGDEE